MIDEKGNDCQPATWKETVMIIILPLCCLIALLWLINRAYDRSRSPDNQNQTEQQYSK